MPCFIISFASLCDVLSWSWINALLGVIRILGYIDARMRRTMLLVLRFHGDSNLLTVLFSTRSISIQD